MGNELADFTNIIAEIMEGENSNCGLEWSRYPRTAYKPEITLTRVFLRLLVCLN